MKNGTKLVEYDPLILAGAYKEWINAPYGTKTEKMKQWGKLLGVSHQHINRLLKDFRKGWQTPKVR